MDRCGAGPVRSPGLLILARLTVAYGALTAILYSGGQAYSRLWSDVFARQIEWLQDDFYGSTVSLTRVDGHGAFRFDAQVTPALATRFEEVPAGAQVWADTLEGYAHLHLIVIFSLLCAWPAGSWRQRCILLATGIPAVALSTSLDIPFALSGVALSEVYTVLDPALLESDPLVIYFEFLQRGGRLLLPLLSAAFAIILCSATTDNKIRT